jgi:beta-lactamase class A
MLRDARNPPVRTFVVNSRPLSLFVRVVAPVLPLLLIGACGGSDRPAGEDPPAADGPARLVEAVDSLAAAAGAEVSMVYRNLGSGDSVLVRPDVRMHAASTMKVPVLLQLFLDHEVGRLSLDDSIPITTSFASIVDGSPFELDASSDSDSTLYADAGGRRSLRELAGLMIWRSSNLATNLLIDRVDARRVTETLRSLGADSMDVLRGVEDIPAFQAGLNNTTTARDLATLMTALGNGTVASEASRAEMLDILGRQEFRSKIPAGLPAGVRVANKTGWITRISHDAALVFPPADPPYVLVVLTRGVESEVAEGLIAEVSRRVWSHHTGGA